MADERPAWIDPGSTGDPNQVFLTTRIASTPWRPKAAAWHRYLVWSGFAVAVLFLGWAAWAVHAQL